MTTPDELADLPYAGLLRPHSGPLAVEGDYDTVHFDRLAFEDDAAGGSRFLESAVTDCVFSGTGLRRARFNDVWASGTRLTGVSLADTDWLDSALIGCSLAGVEAFGAILRRVVFRRCKLDSVNLRTAALHEVVFEDCVLRDVDFGEAALDRVAFPGSRLERARFGRAALKKTDLRGAVAIDLADGYDSLRGAVVSPTQLLDLAPHLAATLGILVQDG
ncbi:pentapeptide repeat-containing protein [Streptomyces sp. V4-01]|uniref:Pentapeptide repeat-containing protein n=1 Tax=Actinacidiphila polyblastidii TaxID=3110430 RepID=A0ABU7PBW4_9ACTN|nr:pentapeptide repeat-containing protein [Streptomyces sp. V4-01]